MEQAKGKFELVRMRDHDGWQKVASEVAFDSPHVHVEKASFLTPTRQEKPVPWSIVHRKAAVAVAPILEDGRFVLVSQERIPVQASLWEFPAGQIDVPVDQVTEELARRTAITELMEETGSHLVESGSLEPLGYFFPSQGFTQEHVYLFVARPVRIVANPTAMGGEFIHGIRGVSPRELKRMVAENEITTALTLALYARLSALGMIDA